MQYGLDLSNAGAYGDPRTLAELAHLAEDAGWDGVFLEDYIMHWCNQATYDPWIALAAMAMNTKHITLGITVTPLPRRRPWKIAREAVTLDHLSQGRFVLGVGIGNGKDADFAHLSEETNDRQRAAMLDEALEIIVGLWSGQPFSYQGEHFNLQEVTFLPKPLQQPRIPIWVGGGWPLKGPTQRAIRWDGSCMYKHTNGGEWQDWTPEDVQALRSMLETQRGTNAQFDIKVGGRERRDDLEQEREFMQSIAEAGVTWHGEFIPPCEPALVREQITQGPLRVE